MGQQHVHLTRPASMLAHVVLDYRVPAAEPVLGPQTLIDALGGVVLLSGKTPVLLKDPVYHPAVGFQLGSSWRAPAPVPRRYRLPEHLAHRISVHLKDPGRLPDTHPLHHAGPAHTRVYLHLVHHLCLRSCSLEHDRRRAGGPISKRHSATLDPALPVHSYCAVYILIPIWDILHMLRRYMRLATPLACRM